MRWMRLLAVRLLLLRLRLREPRRGYDAQGRGPVDGRAKNRSMCGQWHTGAAQGRARQTAQSKASLWVAHRRDGLFKFMGDYPPQQRELLPFRWEGRLEVMAHVMCYTDYPYPSSRRNQPS